MPLSDDQLCERFNARVPPTGLLFKTRTLAVDRKAGRVRMAFDIDHRFTNPRGTIQGGIVTAMLDDCAATAGIVALGEAGFIASLELKTSFFAPALPGLLYAEGLCLKMGRSSCFLEAELRDEDGKLLAKLTTSAIPIRSQQKPVLVPAAGS